MDDLLKRFRDFLMSEGISQVEADRESYEDYCHREASHPNRNVTVLPANPADPLGKRFEFPTNMNGLADLLRNMPRPKYPPLDRLPCANVQVAQYKACENLGMSACGACKLVSYCSKACQKEHWRRHKRDCRNPLRSSDWTPSWVRERRRPSFLVETTLEEETDREFSERFSMGTALWGNTPARDMLNLACNENDIKRDYSLAFIASGDLRNILRTVNGLPLDYSGKLNILVNDLSLPIACRNLTLLLILGNIADESMAVDIALYFWYSAFMPGEYRLEMTMTLAKYLEEVIRTNGTPYVRLGSRSKLFTCFEKKFTVLLQHFMSSDTSVGDIQDEYDRVRTAPSRRDYRDRMYTGLKLSHRAAFQEFRRFGIVLPFGAINAHFNVPNLSLFSLEGRWFQTDYADPLEGWDINTVVATGKAHGAQPEDIYGCLYFFLRKELRAFARRLKTFDCSFTLTSLDARHLPTLINDGTLSKYNIDPSIRFDRIDASNIFDTEYVGIDRVLSLWKPFLQSGKEAAILGYFMNWVMRQQDGRVSRAGEGAMKDLIADVLKKNQSTLTGVTPTTADVHSLLIKSIDDIEALYENSKPFSKFLKKQGLDAILRKTKLKLREQHKVLPHRLLTPLKSPSNALPEFVDQDSWYYNTKLTCCTWSERFVEFENA